MRMLKCPSCKRQTAELRYGTKDGRRYKQKVCRSCGYEGKRVYRGRR